MSWLATTLVLSTPGFSDSRCGHRYTDAHGLAWSYNLTALSVDGADYLASDIDGRYALNFCRPPASPCQVAGTASAVKYIGPKCTVPRCKQPCELLGWGALGGPTTQFSLIDPSEPMEGLRLTSVGLLSTAPLNASVVDEWGNPRPPLLTVDLVCEPTAPVPAAPMEVITLTGQQPGDTTLKLRSPLACPVKSLARTPTEAACKVAAAAGFPSEGASSPATERPTAADQAAAARSRASGGGGWSWFAGLLSCMLLGVLLFFVYAPISLRARLSTTFQDPFGSDDLGGAWPVAAANVDDDDDALLDAGGPRVSSRRVRMDYRAM